MSYNKLFLCSLALWLAGCASSPTIPSAPGKTSAAGTEAKSDVDKEIVMYALAMADIKSNKLDQARELLTTLTNKHPELAGPWANMALIDIKDKDLDKARQHLDMAIKRDPSMPQAYNLLGYVDKQQGLISKAIDDYQQAIAKKPDYALAHYNLALLYDIYLQDVPKAVEHYQRYLALTNNQDKKTADWVKELQSSMKRGTP